MPFEGFHRAIFSLAGSKVALNERHKTVMVIRSKQVQLSELLSNQKRLPLAEVAGYAERS
jgi:hypothetical protein